MARLVRARSVRRGATAGGDVDQELGNTDRR